MSLVLALALVSAEPTDARAASTPEIRWEAPPSCPTPGRFAERVDALREPDTRWAEVSAHARVHARSSGGFDLELRLRSAVGTSTRHVYAADCEILADATALILASFVEPVDTVQRIDERPRPRPARPPARSHPPQIPEPAAPSPSTRPPTPPPPPPDEFEIGVGGLVGRAALPSVDLGPMLNFGWERGLMRLDATAMALLPQRRPFEPRPEVVLRLWAAGGGLATSLSLPVSAHLDLAMGLGLEIAATVARGEGISRPRTIVRPWVAPLGTVRLLWRPHPHWCVWLGAAAVVAAVRPTFTVADQGPAPLGPGGLRGMGGIQWRWTR